MTDNSKRSPTSEDPMPSLPQITSPRQIVPPVTFVPKAIGLTVQSGPGVGTAPAHLTNHGGPVLGAVRVVPIYWGATWAAGDSALAAQLNAFFDMVLTSTMMDMLAEYSTATQIGHGSRAPSVTITNSEPGTIIAGVRTVTDAQIQQALATWIGNGIVPSVTVNTLYFVYLPRNVVSTMGGGSSCQQYCGYHSHFAGNTYYAVIPFADCPGCQFAGPFIDTLTEVTSHELCESITDPALNAWWDSSSGDEIGDICNRQTVSLGGFLVQTEWSNAQGICTILPTSNSPKAFAPSYNQGDPGYGIGGYDLKSVADRAFAFDYDHSGKMDHIALYRPGTGTMWILKNSGGTFNAVYNQGDPGNGIGGYDLKSANDRAFAFDYDHSGKMDHIALYRPGTGTMWILKNNGGTFTAVYNQGDPGNGIGGYDLKSVDDRAFAFDYDHSGKMDHIALYRPGTGTMWILKNNGGTFTAVYNQGAPGNGIGGYDLKSADDRAFAFDYDHSGKMDHIALYRPGTGTMWILKNNGGNFTAVYNQGDPGNGIGGYDLTSLADEAMAFDYDGSGKQDYITLYRPGTGTIWILKNNGGTFLPVYNQGDPGQGIGGYDLKSSADRAFAFDYESAGKANYLSLYRPNTGTIWILKRLR